ncbi:hypothetical protein [Lactiplantibacillus mudanjiangensis]|uniref:hypothetical protein n=1 Tax=Lactiplantibacillus mudanjiangensis TaxID=1296538 RepID=UPI001030C280
MQDTSHLKIDPNQYDLIITGYFKNTEPIFFFKNKTYNNLCAIVRDSGLDIYQSGQNKLSASDREVFQTLFTFLKDSDTHTVKLFTIDPIANA